MLIVLKFFKKNNGQKNNQQSFYKEKTWSYNRTFQIL
jgi:hypothetical protein